MSRRKDIFIAAARGDFAGSEEDVQEAFAAFPLPDVDSSQLHHQLRLLKTLFKDSHNSTVTTTTVAKTLVSLPPITQDLFKDTFVALKSCPSMPVFVASCER